mmetsp:Transcript_6127/g.17564  ORF Transcript_6127/g.17564 Transcript_6127/m.17564 type:complete len:229 (+) Transcript_6127:429-1115(+)|eukprot:CAMPEP_0206144528 /NCGR_PEP_ID=MMETSP1473-20131121/24398_1 /ASSEMBLY_ACC=CAM_ASM_001109 /TAXON_ID=1461547 /ORGANISM="Stichococcus sp, Strain RCC1054" /LENGTH=228 /DNA_ID=CAMNT_0053540369 /DNA_START=385 /DNA_END=1071 /DNA_ORIENTATION=-
MTDHSHHFANGRSLSELPALCIGGVEAQLQGWSPLGQALDECCQLAHMHQPVVALPGSAPVLHLAAKGQPPQLRQLGCNGAGPQTHQCIRLGDHEVLQGDSPLSDRVHQRSSGGAVAWRQPQPGESLPHHCCWRWQGCNRTVADGQSLEVQGGNGCGDGGEILDVAQVQLLKPGQACQGSQRCHLSWPGQSVEADAPRNARQHIMLVLSSRAGGTCLGCQARKGTGSV